MRASSWDRLAATEALICPARSSWLRVESSTWRCMLSSEAVWLCPSWVRVLSSAALPSERAAACSSRW